MQEAILAGKAEPRDVVARLTAERDRTAEWHAALLLEADVAENSSWAGGSTSCGTPTQPTIPPGRTARTACSIDSAVPTASQTASAPTPAVSSRTFATPSSPRSTTMSVAPNFRASAWREACRLKAMTRLAPSSAGREDRAQPDSAITGHGDGYAWLDASGDGGVPAGAHDVGQGEQAGEEVVAGLLGGDEQGAVGLGMRMYSDWQPSKPVLLTQENWKPARQCGQVPSEA